jgi:hypothetical protein
VPSDSLFITEINDTEFVYSQKQNVTEGSFITFYRKDYETLLTIAQYPTELRTGDFPNWTQIFIARTDRLRKGLVVFQIYFEVAKIYIM